MRTTARLLLIGTIAAAAFASGGAVASADTRPAEVADSGSAAGSSQASVALVVGDLLRLLQAGSGPGGDQAIAGLRELLVDSGSFTRCQLDPPRTFPCLGTQ
ncbi:hypothetical protein [Nocardia sp. NPDC005978]|uniref:hypothetical protein n=1 Tax=unclassified Nocardia TaxID=2637762 RepID=UPI0033A6BCBB